MNKAEAKGLANEVLARYRAQRRKDLLRLLEGQDHFDVIASSGKPYQVDVDAVWDDRKGNNLRVLVAIDDGGFSAFMPLVVAFIVAPDGTFVGEP